MEFFLEEDDHLKLKAHDEEHLELISACIQDALVPLSCFHFDKEEQSFKMLLNRFQWEKSPIVLPAETFYLRTHTALLFEDVTHVDYRGIAADHSLKMLNILMLYAGKPGFIHILCAEGIVIRLHINKISCYFHDLNDPWPTHHRPDHFTHVA
jgi:hypothetical protein